MKINVLKILLIFLFLPVVIFAQQPDSSKKKIKTFVKQDTSSAGIKKEQKSVTKKVGKTESKFLDKNANGIDDRMEMKGKHGQMGKKGDVFIDKDGDGICDGRESAIGLKKIMRHRHRGKPPK